MARVAFTKVQTRLWSLAVILFAAASVLGLFFGKNFSSDIAFRYHEHAAQGYLADHDYRRALDELKALVWLEPENADAVLNLADAHLVLGEWLEARDWLETVELEGKENWVIDEAVLMVQIELASGNSDVESWVKQIEESPINHKVPFMFITAHIRADAAKRAGDGKLSNEIYGDLLDQFPDNKEAAFRLARAAQFQMRSADMAKYTRMIRDGVDSYSYRWYTAEFRRIQADAHLVLDRGQAELNAGAALPGKRLELMGLAALDLGQWERAMDIFERAESAGGGSWQVEYWLGVRADAQGDRETALAKFRAAAQKQPWKNSLAQRNVDRLTKN